VRIVVTPDSDTMAAARGRTVDDTQESTNGHGGMDRSCTGRRAGGDIAPWVAMLAVCRQARGLSMIVSSAWRLPAA
jgi:hypothetical protein